MRALFPVVLASVLIAASCNMSNPASPGNGFSLVAGNWTGTARDSTGSMLGTGVVPGTSVMKWQLTQSGGQVTGSIAMSGVNTPLAPVVNGAIDGTTFAFEVSMPSGSIPNSGCTAAAHGTMTVNAEGTAMTGTYSGTNSCSGTYSDGTVTLTKVVAQ